MLTPKKNTGKNIEGKMFSVELRVDISELTEAIDKIGYDPETYDIKDDIDNYF